MNPARLACNFSQTGKELNTQCLLRREGVNAKLNNVEIMLLNQYLEIMYEEPVLILAREIILKAMFALDL